MGLAAFASTSRVPVRPRIVEEDIGRNDSTRILLVVYITLRNGPQDPV
jgi:hypothetical protein